MNAIELNIFSLKSSWLYLINTFLLFLLYSISPQHVSVWFACTIDLIHYLCLLPELMERQRLMERLFGVIFVEKCIRSVLPFVVLFYIDAFMLLCFYTGDKLNIESANEWDKRKSVSFC